MQRVPQPNCLHNLHMVNIIQSKSITRLVRVREPYYAQPDKWLTIRGCREHKLEARAVRYTPPFQSTLWILDINCSRCPWYLLRECRSRVACRERQLSAQSTYCSCRSWFSCCSPGSANCAAARKADDRKYRRHYRQQACRTA